LLSKRKSIFGLFNSFFYQPAELLVRGRKTVAHYQIGCLDTAVMLQWHWKNFGFACSQNISKKENGHIPSFL